jgi:hypothetical protein
MARRITIIQGHPDVRGNRVGHALAAAYAHGTEAAGHEVTVIEVAQRHIGMIEAPDKANRGRWLAQMRRLGHAGR